MNAFTAAQEKNKPHQKSNGKTKRQEKYRDIQRFTGQTAHDQQHRHYGEVLRNQQANRNIARTLMQFADIFKYFYRDSRRADGQAESQQYCQLPRPFQIERKHTDDQIGDGNLKENASNGCFPDAHKRFQVKLHPDQVEQHQHAQLGQNFNIFTVLDKAEGGTPQNHSGQQIADNRRLFQPCHNHPENQGNCRNEGNFRELMHCLLRNLRKDVSK